MKTFSIQELVTTLQSVKLRKAAGFDEIYPEIFNSGNSGRMDYIVFHRHSIHVEATENFQTSQCDIDPQTKK
jgi:hypothetical protein